MKNEIHILLVEDETAIREGLTDVLVYHGYKVDSADTGTEGLQKALGGKYQLVLLDVMLPGMDGFEICERIRKTDRDQAIIMLTARDSDDDIINGLRLGADDYVAKPFSVQQLVLRIQAVLRRTHSETEQMRTIKLPNLTIDTQNLSAEGAENIAFTRREMDVLVYLAQHHDRPVPREELLAKVWGYARNLDIETRTVDIHIAKIRRKIEQDSSEPRNLITVRGAGYRLVPESE